MPDHILDSGDSPDLEALFDSIASQQKEATETQPAAEAAVQSTGTAHGGNEEMYEQIGQITRKMHNTLRDMGYDKSLERVADAIPDARDRLSYIASLTKSAADRVLNAIDVAQPLQDNLGSSSQTLSERWNLLYANQLSTAEFKQLADDTRQYLNQVPQQTHETSTQLLEIVMAQDFQDLTGQVIKKMMDMFKTLEAEMVALLVEFSPEHKKGALDTSLLNGPAINQEGNPDVMSNQQQVDDLLDSLGF
ncbi:chemotaxis response - phosphatase CheZ [Aquitalea magnusonii]|uniref:Protein phosphatase CheZ n=1 Tax=Aquitalea magnusonii TaxID=332411 RepID=A0A3G9GG12_9NEIS|nr:protein phosphatase CheZ [Aquitalea magnusonii]BBF84577.1 chemotaxis response - phosphatase CheZ [Aquitalea magnusonii]